MDEFAGVRNPTVVLIMQAAAEFKKLQAKAAALKGKAGKPGAQGKPAPQLPANRQQQPRAAAARKALDAKFRSGKANAHDLARIL